MKSKLALVLMIAALSFFASDLYFKEKTVQYDEANKLLDAKFKDLNKISELNQWIAQNVVTDLNNLDTLEVSESSLINFVEDIKKSFDTNIQNIDKSKKGVLKVSLDAKIPRSETENMIHLFKTKITNGFFDIKKVDIDQNYIKAQFDLIKYYKGQ